MTTVYVVRHGATDWTYEGRAQGQADVELNEEGRKQAAELAQELARVRVGAVYSSDLKRAADTARVIAQSLGLEVMGDSAFREIDQGEWTGLTVAQIKERWPEGFEARHGMRRPGGESPEDLRERVFRGLGRAIEAHPNGTVVLVTHGGPIRWLAVRALGRDKRSVDRIRGLDTGAAVVLRAEVVHGELVLSGFTRLDGKTADLEGPPSARRGVK